MQEVIPRLWIGDYASSQSLSTLLAHGISHIVAAMKQDYPVLHPSLTVHRILIDDSPKTNIIAHFPASSNFIRTALASSPTTSVLVHCQAGISRSTTLVAAYLMEEQNLDVEQAVDLIRSVRSQVEPTEVFLQQLEMFERCECEWDPIKWNEQRRFLMGFAQAEIMGTRPI